MFPRKVLFIQREKSQKKKKRKSLYFLNHRIEKGSLHVSLRGDDRIDKAVVSTFNYYVELGPNNT